MARVIIGVHGLGNKPDPETLRSWWEQSMIEGLQKRMDTKQNSQGLKWFTGPILYTINPWI